MSVEGLEDEKLEREAEVAGAERAGASAQPASDLADEGADAPGSEPGQAANLGGEPSVAAVDAASAPASAVGKERKKGGRARSSDAASSGGGDEAPDSAVPGYRVELPMFEGPLDLLLHLVQKHELDILDIPIAFVTEKYTAYIRLMDELNIDLASEYLVLAATLIHIKSRMLLPNPPREEEDGEEEAGDDPRADLVRRLLEYQKYKAAAEELAQRSILGKDVFPRGSSVDALGGNLPLMSVSMFQLIDVFQSVLERTAQTRQHEIDFERFSISEKISDISERLERERRLRFEQLFDDDRSRVEVIITFLALLEMTRLRMTWLFQEGPLEPIWVELRVTDDAGEEEGGEESEGEGSGAARQGALRGPALDDDRFVDDEDSTAHELWGDEAGGVPLDEHASELDAEAQAEADDTSELEALEGEPEHDSEE